MSADEAQGGWLRASFERHPNAEDYVGLRVSDAKALAHDRDVPEVRVLNATSGIRRNLRRTRLTMYESEGVVMRAAWF